MGLIGPTTVDGDFEGKGDFAVLPVLKSCRGGWGAGAGGEAGCCLRGVLMMMMMMMVKVMIVIMMTIIMIMTRMMMVTPDCSLGGS